MKQIVLLLIVINLVFGGKCPLKEAIISCECDQVSDI